MFFFLIIRKWYQQVGPKLTSKTESLRCHMLQQLFLSSNAHYQSSLCLNDKNSAVSLYIQVCLCLCTYKGILIA